MEARQPKIGYSSESKQLYREKVWDSLLSFEHISKYKGNAKALILPSKDGEEIDHLISLGFCQKDIICIDENPALIASAPWRKKYKSIKCYGCKVSAVADRLKKDGFTVKWANLDLCNNFSEELVTEVSEFLLNAPICEKDFYFSVTVSKGREQSVTNYLMNLLMQSGEWQSSDYTKMSEKRIACLMRVISPSIPKSKVVKLISEESYIHHKTPMAFACFSISDQMKSHIVSDLFEIAAFEKSLFNRCSILSFEGRLHKSWPYYHNGIDRFSSLKEMENDFPDMAAICREVVDGSLDDCAAMARLIIKEHHKGEEIIDRLFCNSMDRDISSYTGLGCWLYDNSVNCNDVAKIKLALSYFDRIKSKYA